MKCRPAGVEFNPFWLLQDDSLLRVIGIPECLEEMGSLLDRFGISVCQPSAPVALKTIAQQIGDRDSGVRSAALNALVSAHVIIGDQLWKILNSVSVCVCFVKSFNHLRSIAVLWKIDRDARV